MKPKVRAPKDGQILILMAMLSTTLIILFGMVVSIGHLIEAKMNLQNAVDLAAMTGASWQARYLNHIALVNYRMRQNYKFTLYDLYVTQSRFNKGFRDVVAAQYSPGMDPFQEIPKNRWVFGICQQREGYFPRSAIGESGEGTAPGTDMCQNVDDTKNFIPPIVASPIVGTNPILIAANSAIAGVGKKAQQVCLGASGQNDAYFNYVMSNLDQRQGYQMNQLQNVISSFSTAFQPTSGPITGGGMATSAIANTFQQNLISANSGATIQFINPPETLSVSGDFSADFTAMINNHQPPPTAFTNYFDVLEAFFSIRVVNMSLGGGGGCQFSLKDRQYPIGSGGSLGVFLGIGRSRNDTDSNARPKIPFVVALRGEVKPNLLFWPQGLTPTLVAVAAAKPFGSRLGPPKAQSDYEVSGGAGTRTAGGQDIYPLANMSFFPGDVDTGGSTYAGMGHTKILGYLFNALPNPTKGTNSDRPHILNAEGNCNAGSASFVCLALSPTLYEGLFWTVFPFPTSTANGYPGQSVIASLFPSEVPLKVAADNPYELLDRMNGPAGNQNELWHYTSDKLGDNPIFKGNDGAPLFFADRNTTLSSWSPTDTNYVQGRFGYQIKLTSLTEICDDIQAGGVATMTSALQGYCYKGSSYNNVYH